jgi:hypothetical protein
MKTTTGKFKKGDKVICLKTSQCHGYIKGLIYIVKDVGFFIGTETDSNGNTTNGYLPEFFELAGPRYKRNLPSWW